MGFLLLGLFAPELVLGFVLFADYFEAVHCWNGFSLGDHGRGRSQNKLLPPSPSGGGPKGRLWTTTVNIIFPLFRSMMLIHK